MGESIWKYVVVIIISVCISGIIAFSGFKLFANKIYIGIDDKIIKVDMRIDNLSRKVSDGGMPRFCVINVPAITMRYTKEIADTFKKSLANNPDMLSNMVDSLSKRMVQEISKVLKKPERYGCDVVFDSMVIYGKSVNLKDITDDVYVDIIKNK